MTQVELHHGAASDVGRVRAVNEDACLAAPPVFVVADGMGGHEGGDVASAIVVEEFGRLAERGYDPAAAVDAVRATLAACQLRILAYADEQARRGVDPRRSAGTTAVAALLAEEAGRPVWLIANLGDSRAYRVCDGRLEQVTTDHSLVQELADAGEITREEMATHPGRHVVTRALGDAPGADADYVVVPLADAERVLLCSDGVNGMLDDTAIALVLAEAGDPRDAADRLVAAAVVAGGEDNATAVVVDVAGVRSAPGSDAERQRADPESRLGGTP